METEEFIRIARGDQPADLLFKNARLVNVYSGEIYLTDIAIARRLFMLAAAFYAHPCR